VIEPVIARSNGGLAFARAEGQGGNGAIAGSVNLDNIVHGETTGEIDLDEFARGGMGTITAGSASTRLDLDAHNSAVRIELEAQAGGAAQETPIGNNPAGNLTGHAEAHLSNDAGPIDAQVAGEAFDSPGGDAGSGEALTTAQTSGDNHDVRIFTLGSGGSAGNAGPFSGSGPRRVAKGGSGRATAVGTALGDSFVNVSSVSGGGSGVTSAGEMAGANSFASATAHGASDKLVQAYAQAGGGGSFFADNTLDRTALGHAESLVTGPGQLQATARTTGGAGSTALSQAESTGSSVVRESASLTVGDESVGYLANRSLFTTASFRQTISPPTGPEPFGISALIHAEPNKTFSDTHWLQGNPNALAAVASGFSTVAQGYVSSMPSSSWTAALSVDLDRGALLGGNQNVELAFLDPTLPSGFNSLEVAISVDGTFVSDHTFHDAASAQTALDDNLVSIDLSTLGSDPIATITLSYIWSSSTPLAFSSDFVLLAHAHVAPEPAAWLLFGFACLIVGARRIR
jgi:hypothetical protein